MASIAFLDHSYHRRTQSTAFLPDLLIRHGHTVTPFWDEAWQGGPPVEWGAMADHDIIIMFQSLSHPPDRSYRLAHPNVIYVPMLDQFGFSQGPVDLSAFWAPLAGSKVLNFSQSLHCVTLAAGVASHFVRFFQQANPAGRSRQPGLHGFFWLRRENQVPWQTIRALIGETPFASFHVHLAPDPGSPTPSQPDPADAARLNLTTSKWVEDKSAFNELIDRANVFFAPRLEEGIGQSFLEAMARGQCVVAPDLGTMNEYITHGVNGLLYDPKAPEPLEFADAAELGVMAQRTVREGYRRWKEAESALVRFIEAPSASLYAPGTLNVLSSSATADQSGVTQPPPGIGRVAKRVLETSLQTAGSIRNAFRQKT